jgi:hypothetical protein
MESDTIEPVETEEVPENLEADDPKKRTPTGEGVPADAIDSIAELRRSVRP